MDKKHNLFIYDNMLTMGAYWVCSGTIVAAMTNYYNLPLWLANILTSITATLMLLQMPGALFFSKLRNKMAYLYSFNLIWRLLLPVVFFSVLFAGNIGVVLFIFANIIMVSFMHLVAPAQTAWTVNAVQGKAGPSFYTKREMLFIFLHISLFCLSATILYIAQNNNEEKTGFFLIGSILCAVLLISIVILFKMPKFSEETNVAIINAKEQKKKKTSELLMQVLKNKAFMRVLITSGLWSFSNMFVGSFAAVYQVRMLQLPFLDILIWTTIGGLMRGALAPFVQRLATRISWQRVVQVAVFTMLIGGVGWLFITPNNKNLLYPILSILLAIPFAGLSVGFLQMQVVSMGKNADRTVYFSMLATTNGVCSFIGSLVCSSLIGYIETTQNSSNLRLVFVVGVVFMVCTILFAQRIGQHMEIRKNKLKDTINEMRTKYPHAIGEPIKRQKPYIRIFRKLKNKFMLRRK